MNALHGGAGGAAGVGFLARLVGLGILVGLTGGHSLGDGGAQPPATSSLPLPATEQVNVLFHRVRGHNTLVQVNTLVVAPGSPPVLYWAVDDAGVLKSTDGGTTWQQMNHGLPTLGLSTIAIDPADPNHLMVGYGSWPTSQTEYPYESRDGGQRWEPTLVCEREDGLVNVRQDAGVELLRFDPLDPSRFYLLVATQSVPPVPAGCGGFYRSCDVGRTYDVNFKCLTTTGAAERLVGPACFQADPPPQLKPPANDASVLAIDVAGGDREILMATGVHAWEGALMTSHDGGNDWAWEDVIDTRNTWVDPAAQGVSSLYVTDVVLAPSNPSIRYAAVSPLLTRCADGVAHPTVAKCNNDESCGPAGSAVDQRHLVVRWDGVEMSDSTMDGAGSNDCDQRTAQDRVWRPVFDGLLRPSQIVVQSVLVHPEDPNRIFVAGWKGSPALPAEVLLLEPAGQGQPWVQALLLESTEHDFVRLVQDPADVDAFYVVARPRTKPGTDVPLPGVGNRLYRLRFDGASWQSAVLADTSELFHVYDLLAIEEPPNRRVAVAHSRGVQLGDELGSDWTSPLSGPPASALERKNGQVFMKNTWNFYAGPTFSTVGLMDVLEYRKLAMCTNGFHDLAGQPGSSGLFAATSSGVWRHPDPRATTWIGDDLLQLSTQWERRGLAAEYVWSIAFDPKDALRDTLLAGTRDGEVHRSTDRGLTWSPDSLHASVPPGLHDVRDFAFRGASSFATSSEGVLRQASPGSPWELSVIGDRISRLAAGSEGEARVYAAGDGGLLRTRDAGATWEVLPGLAPAPPYSAVLETVGRDGRHHLWVPDRRAGLYRISTTMTARQGSDLQSVILSWTPTAGQGPVDDYVVAYGTDPDAPSGVVHAGPATEATVTGVDLRTGPIHVTLSAVVGAQTSQPGLPLTVTWDYTYSPRIQVSDACGAGIRLAWPAVPQADGYFVYRSPTGVEGSFVRLNTAPIPGTATEFVDTDVSDGQTHWYFMTTLFPAAVYAELETAGGNIGSALFALTDADGDTYIDCEDNCPQVWNIEQLDHDGDGVGSYCDVCPLDPDDDADGDGACADVDNCPQDPNPQQEDPDTDGLGNPCDGDDDGDGHPDAADDCPLAADPLQEDRDGDGIGDACDVCPDDASNDADQDLVCEDEDNCPGVFNPAQIDVDGDGVGGKCDNCPWTSNFTQFDQDSDGVGSACDLCPNVYNPGQTYVGNPIVEVIDPDGGESVAVGTNLSLQWSASDACGGVSSVDLLLSRKGTGGPFETIAAGIANTGSHAWTVTAPATIGYKAFLKVVARDPAGDTGMDLSDAGFRITSPACEPCQPSYCSDVGTRCSYNGTCGFGGCCSYTCVPDASCSGAETCPENACGCF